MRTADIVAKALNSNSLTECGKQLGYLDEHGYMQSLFHYLTDTQLTPYEYMQFKYRTIQEMVEPKNGKYDSAQILAMFNVLMIQENIFVFNSWSSEFEDNTLDNGLEILSLADYDRNHFLALRIMDKRASEPEWSEWYFFWGDFDEVISGLNNGMVACNCGKRWLYCWGEWDSDDTKWDWSKTWDGQYYYCECGEQIIPLY